MFLSYRNQPIDLKSKSTDWFPYKRTTDPEWAPKNIFSDLKPLTTIPGHLSLSFTLKIRYIHFPSLR